MLGYRESEMLGRIAGEFIDPGFRHEFETQFHGRDQHIQRIYEIPFNTSDGRKIYASVNATTITDDIAHSPADKGGSFAFINDITEKKQIAEHTRKNEEKFRAIADYTYDWESWFATDGSLVWVNPAVERITGYSADECMRMDGFPHKLVEETDKNIFTEMFHDSLAGGINSEREFRVRNRHNGQAVWVGASFQPTFDNGGKMNGTRWSVRDITRRKEINQQLMAAKETAEAANRAKSGFLSNMSHELRTPLNAVLGFAQMISSEISGKLSESQKEYMGYIEKSGQHLLHIINEILDLSKIESGSMSMEISPLAPGQVIADTLELVSADAHERGVTILHNMDFPEIPSVLGDAVRLKQALLNLLSNAIKFNCRNCDVSISAHTTDRGTLVINIEDKGKGVPPSNRHEMFQPFSRLDAENSGTGGTGVGLVITRKIMEMMNGSVGFDSVRGRGSKFWVELPLADPGASYASPGYIGIGRMNPGLARVFYIYSDPDEAREMGAVSEGCSLCELIPVPSIRISLELAGVHRPDIFIVDQAIFGKDGNRVMNWVRESGLSIPVVALDADITPAKSERLLADGYDKCMGKPFERAKMQDLLAELAPEYANNISGQNVIDITSVKKISKSGS